MAVLEGQARIGLFAASGQARTFGGGSALMATQHCDTVDFRASSEALYYASYSPKGPLLNCVKPVDLEIPTFIVGRSDLLDEKDPDRLSANRRQIEMYVASCSHYGDRVSNRGR